MATPKRTRKGVPNKKKQAFRERLQAYCTRHNADPHYWMARMLGDTTTYMDAEGVIHPTVPLSIKVDCASQLAQYLQPKLRSVEVSGDADNPVALLHAMADADLDALIARRLRDAGYNGDHTGLPEEGREP